MRDAFKTITGKIVHGRRVAQTLGYPTANIFLGGDTEYASLRGVYFSQAFLENGQSYHALTNIGIRPSVTENETFWLECHMLNFTGNIYGQQITVRLMDKIRDEMKFDNLDELRARINQDILAAEAYFSKT